MLKKLISYLESQGQISESKQQEIIEGLWKEKAELIKDIHIRYTLILDAYEGRGDGLYKDRLCELDEKFMQSKDNLSNDQKGTFSSRDIEIYIEVLKLILADSYMPPLPPENGFLTGIQVHLETLYILIMVMITKAPKISYITTMKIDLSMAKLSHIAKFVGQLIDGKGKRLDTTRNQIKTRAGCASETKEAVLETCQAMDRDRQNWKRNRSKDAIYKEIKKELKERHGIERGKTSIRNDLKEFKNRGRFSI